MKKRIVLLKVITIFILMFLIVSVTDVKSDNQEFNQGPFVNTSGKEVTGLGITPIINPEYGNGNWNKVWFGSGSAPLRFNVLNTHETNMSQGKVGMLLDCDSIVRGADKAMNNFWLYEWPNSDLARSVKWILDDRFDETERAAGILLPPNKPNKSDTDGADIHSAGNKKYMYTNPANKWSNAFILDAYEVLNPTYGFPTTEGPSALRKKTGGTEYWLRSENGNLSQSDYVAYVSDSKGMGLKNDGWNENSVAGVSPAINLNVSKVLFSTLVSGEVGTHDAEYKLTVIDDYVECKTTYSCRDLYSFKIAIPSGGQVTRNGRTFTIPFSITGGINKNSITQISVLVTDKPWNSEGAQILSYGKLENIEGNIRSGGTGTYRVPDAIGLYDENVGGAYVYIFAESVREGNKPDHASNLIKLNFTKDIRVDEEDYSNHYDGEEHGITVTPYTDGTVIKYGLTEGTYNLNESPKYINAGTNVRVYYEVTLDGRNTLRDSKVIEITKRPIKVSGIEVDQKEYDGNTSATINLDELVLDGLLPGEDIRLTNYSATFVDKNSNPFQKVNLTYELTGDDIANYELDTLNSQKTTKANIYQRHIIVSKIKVYPKVWDGTTSARLDFSEVEIDRLVEGDDLYITANGEFENVAVGYDKLVTITDLTLNGTDKNNYYLEEGLQQTTASGNISSYGTLPIIHIPDDLTFEYDGTEHVVGITATSTVENADPIKVSITYSEEQSLTSPLWSSAQRSLTDVGTLRVYYHVTDQNQGIAEVNGSFVIRVTPALATVKDNSVTITSKVYDGTTSANPVLENATFDGLKGSDVDYLYLKTGIAEFSDKNAGENKEVTLNSLTLGNVTASNFAKNYRLESTATTRGTITKRPLTISGIKAENKVYDGNTTATIDTSNMIIDNLVTGDDVSVVVTGSFVNANAGDNKTINLTLTLSGADASNYYIDEESSQKTTTAAIIKKDLTIQSNDINLEYDGENHSATVTVIEDVPVTIKYGTEEDDCTLNDSPVYSELGSNNVYYTITSESENYNSKTGVLYVQINPRSVKVSGIKANDKDYDGNQNVILDTSNIKLENVLNGNDVKVSVTGSFEDATTGENKLVNLSYTLSGANAGNYQIDEILSQMNTMANITLPEYTVTFNLNGGTTDGDNTVKVIEGNKVLRPPKDPNKENNTFAGWYEDAELTKTFDFDNKVVTSDLTIYAKWDIPSSNLTITGDNQTFTLGDTNDIEITCSGALADLTAIKVNGSVLDKSKYSLVSGSTVLTLNNAYLNTLSKGDYKVTFEYGDESIDAKFTIVEAEQNGDTAGTGDNTTTDPENNNTGANENTNTNTSGGSKSDIPQTGDNIMTYVIMFVVSVIGLAGGAIYIKRKKIFVNN